MSATGPERRARRQRSKPYERPPSKPSSLSSLWSVLTAPFKRGSSLSDTNQDSGSYSGSDDSEVEETTTVESRRIPEPYTPSPAALQLSKRGEQMLDPNYQSSLSTVPPSQTSSATFGSAPSTATVPGSRYIASVKPFGQLQTSSVSLVPTELTLFSRQNDAPSRSTSPQDRNAPTASNRYQQIVDFLQSKGEAKLNNFELLGIAQSLKDSSDVPPEALLGLINNTPPPSDVPSAALLTIRSSRPSTPSAPRPFLAPPTSETKATTPQIEISLPNSPIPVRRHRRRSTYVGVGQTTPRRYAVSKNAAEAHNIDDKEASGTKKRRIGDFGAPTTSGEESSAASSPPHTDKPNIKEHEVSPPLQNTVQFPMSSPAKPHAPSEAPSEPVRSHRVLPRTTGLFTRPSSAPSPLRKVLNESSQASEPPSRTSEPKSQASVAILDILMDGTGSLELQNPKESDADARSPLYNPFQTIATPKGARISTPTPRKLLKRPSTAIIEPPVAVKRGFESTQSDNILDQIDSTAPKQPPSKRPKPEKTHLDLNGDSVGRSPINVFPSRTEAKSPFPKPDLVKIPKSRLGALECAIIKTEEPNETPLVLKRAISGPEVIEIDDDEDENVENGVNNRMSEGPHSHVENGALTSSRSPSLSPAKAVHIQPNSVEEVEDAKSPSNVVQPPSRPSNKPRPAPLAPRPGTSNGLLAPNASFKSTSPVIPSPLRHVSLPPDNDEDEETSKPMPEEQSSTVMKLNSHAAEEAPAILSPKSRALRIPLQELSTFDILLPTSIATIQSICKTRESSEALDNAAALPEADLLKYEFAFSDDKNPPSAPATIPLITTTSASPSASPPLSPLILLLQGSWTCPVCACQSPPTAIKCAVCETPKSGGNTSPTSPSSSAQSLVPLEKIPNGEVTVSGGTSFDWAGAGMAKPVASSDIWICGTCGIKNGLDQQKCMACEASRPIPPQSTAPIAGFDWVAAGLKPKDDTNTWTCGTCMVTNDQDKIKCAACESPRP
ncbi:uncharacterized protein EI90DRAFT_3062501 [Cantharellus anzutake]|uniref:uncharacterized protein n=1 Tax=Cantharellus anzutake TaxID=1750568 RepID=UPI001902C62A|nr:uncharacterized protein EI90DRAFT_3062501 [Cantharellus anzutake]KAF8329403.1 hypothetical protein EI90DRAFT_3062501 [Cantharellus anzutake]